MKLKTEAQVRSAERTLSTGTWAIVAGAMLYSVLTVTPLVRTHTPAGWEMTAPILPIVVDAAVVIVVKLDSLIARLGGSGGPWAVVLRWMTGLMTLALNVGDNALRGDLVGVAVHSVSPLLLIVTAETSLAYRRAISKALAEIKRSREAEERDREQRERLREQEARAAREREQDRHEQAQKAAREQAAKVAREAREHDEKLERERLDRLANERQAEREHAAHMERQRLEHEERQAEAERLDQRERAEGDRQERERRDREQADREAQDKREREKREHEKAEREQARRVRPRKQAATREQPADRREHETDGDREQPLRLAPVNISKPPKGDEKASEAEVLEAIRDSLTTGVSVRDIHAATGWSIGWISTRRKELAAETDGEPPEELSA